MFQWSRKKHQNMVREWDGSATLWHSNSTSWRFHVGMGCESKPSCHLPSQQEVDAGCEIELHTAWDWCPVFWSFEHHQNTYFGGIPFSVDVKHGDIETNPCINSYYLPLYHHYTTIVSPLNTSISLLNTIGFWTLLIISQRVPPVINGL